MHASASLELETPRREIANQFVQPEGCQHGQEVPLSKELKEGEKRYVAPSQRPGWLKVSFHSEMTICVLTSDQHGLSVRQTAQVKNTGGPVTLAFGVNNE